MQFYPDGFFMIVCVHIIFGDFNAFFVFVVVVNEGNSECFVQNSREPWKGFNRGKIKNKICLSPLSFYDHLVAKMPTSQDLKFTNFVISILSVFSNQINVSVKLKLHHSPPTPSPPPGQPPGHLTFLKIIVQIPPYLGQNAVQMPHTRIHSGDQMPPPRGHFIST